MKAFWAETVVGWVRITFRSEAISSMQFAEKTTEGQKVDDPEAIRRALRAKRVGEGSGLAPFGTPFQQRVWDAVVKVPFGSTTSYGDLAKSIGGIGHSRAVGQAVGANPIVFLIPCHRVLATSGEVGGYRWGIEVKERLLEWEFGNDENTPFFKIFK